MFNIRGWEWIIILVVVLLIFGPSQLPNLAKSVGKAISSFRGGIREAEEDLKKMAEDDAKPKTEGKPKPDDSSQGKVKGNGANG